MCPSKTSWSFEKNQKSPRKRAPNVIANWHLSITCIGREVSIAKESTRKRHLKLKYNFIRFDYTLVPCPLILLSILNLRC